MISIVIPTIRPQNILTLIGSIHVSEPHEILWEEDTERIGAPKMVKRLTDKAQGEWICFLGDDTLPESTCLDNALALARSGNYLLVGLNDQHSQKATHWIAHRDLLDHLENREYFYTGYIHNFCDDELKHRADKLGRYTWCENAKLIHNHPVFNTALMDEDYKKVLNPENWEHDKKLFQERCCKLSVAMIVKNEEAMLGKCLESIMGVDEIVIVDTGSIDTTKEVAKRFTDKIFDVKWIDDFAQARNFALSKCTGDWILSIDADEILDTDGVAKIRALLLTSKDAIGIQMKCSNNQYSVPRLFRNKPSIRWTGKIHETIGLTDYDKSDVGITYGSSPAHALDPDRNMRILEQTAQDDPENTRNLYYLGREYGYRQDWVKAITTFIKYLSKASWLPERADAYFMLALCYWNTGRGEEARNNCLQALSINSNFKSALLLMAHMSWEHNAIQWRKMAETATNEGTLFARINYTSI